MRRQNRSFRLSEQDGKVSFQVAKEHLSTKRYRKYKHSGSEVSRDIFAQVLKYDKFFLIINTNMELLRRDTRNLRTNE